MHAKVNNIKVLNKFVCTECTGFEELANTENEILL